MNENDNRATLSAPDLESNISDEPLAAEKAPRFTSPVNIRVISYRNRNHDPDGISCKAVLDGIVRAGILADDSAKQVKKISYESIIVKKGEAEKTIIEINDKPS